MLVAWIKMDDDDDDDDDDYAGLNNKLYYRGEYIKTALSRRSDVTQMPTTVYGTVLAYQIS